MGLPRIFCTQCGKLVLDKLQCPACGWVRPPAPPSEVGQAVWQFDLARSNLAAWSDVADGYLFAGWRDGAVRCIDLAQGCQRWCYRLPAGWQAQERIAIGPQLIYCGTTQTEGIGSRDKRLVAIARDTGQEAWCSTEQARHIGSPFYLEGTVYALTSDNQLLALDAASGATLWTREGIPWGPAAPAYGEGVLYYGAHGPTLTALDAHDGRVLWSFRAGGEMAWFALTPTLHQDTLYAPNWDGNLYALDPSSGEEKWRFTATRYMISKVWLWEELVFVSSRDHYVYALDRVTGVLRWKRWFQRAVYCTPVTDTEGNLYLADSGDTVYALSASNNELKWSAETDGRIWTCDPHVLDDQLLIGLRKGEIVAIRLRAEEEPLEGPAYEAAGRWEEAAIAYTLGGDLIHAAEIYARRLDNAAAAGQLYEAAGAWESAGTAYRLAGQPENAERVYRKGNLPGLLADLLMEQGRPLEAAVNYQAAGDLVRCARAYEAGGQLAEAAAAYEQAGDTAKASKLFEQLGKPYAVAELLARRGQRVDAAERFLTLGEWSRAASLLDAEGQFDRSAEIYAQHGDPRSAAERYEKSGALAKAAEHYRLAGDHANAQRLYAALGDLVNEAAEWIQMGNYRIAAETYERAARQLEERDPKGLALQIADLYILAANSYERCFDYERADVCRRRMRFYAGLPYLRLELRHEAEYLVGYLNSVDIIVKNQGFGIARDIHLEPRSEFFDFHFREEPRLPGLLPDKEQTVRLYLQPKEPGQKVPLDILVTYRGPQERQESCRLEADVPVHQQAGGPIPVSTTYNVFGGEVYTGCVEVSRGDKVIGQKIGGDAVQVLRGAMTCRPVPLGGIEGEMPAVEFTCPDCGRPTREGQRFCEACGRRLDLDLATITRHNERGALLGKPDQPAPAGDAIQTAD